jgi:hypothetical protein
MVLGAAGLLVAGLLVWGFLHFLSDAGEQAAAGQVGAIDQAQDIRAQLTGNSAIRAVQGLYADTGSFAQVTPEGLKAFEPTFTYTEGVSTGPDTVSVRGSSQGVGLAISSDSGTCLYAHVTAGGVSYGSGATCTGEAAVAASGPAWPTGS